MFLPKTLFWTRTVPTGQSASSTGSTHLQYPSIDESYRRKVKGRPCWLWAGIECRTGWFEEKYEQNKKNFSPNHPFHKVSFFFYTSISSNHPGAKSLVLYSIKHNSIPQPGVKTFVIASVRFFFFMSIPVFHCESRSHEIYCLGFFFFNNLVPISQGLSNARLHGSVYWWIKNLKSLCLD